MKNQKNLDLQNQFAPAAGLKQFPQLAMPKPSASARKIPVVYHFVLEEPVIVKHVAPAFAA